MGVSQYKGRLETVGSVLKTSKFLILCGVIIQNNEHFDYLGSIWGVPPMFVHENHPRPAGFVGIPGPVEFHPLSLQATEVEFKAESGPIVGLTQWAQLQCSMVHGG